MAFSILTPLQESFLQSFFQSYLGEKFFLTGGTALAAFYLKHRTSQDLDLFTLDQNLNFDEVNAEVRKIAYSLNLNIEHRISSPTLSQFFLKTKQGEILKLDFVREVPIQFGKIKKKGGIRIDSLENIAVNKVLAIYGRLEAKDYLDLYFLIKKGLIDFEKIFKRAQRKDVGLNKLYFASMIVEMVGIKHWPETFESFNHNELVNFYLKLNKKILKEIQPDQKRSQQNV